MNFFFNFILWVASIFLSLYAHATLPKIDGLYVNAFGDKTNPAVIFVHGGPGYDSQDFEFSTAAVLAQKGFYVVVYDQRGQGRSDLAKDPSDYQYRQYAHDLNLIIKTLGLTKSAFIGHSHGGPISLQFDQLYPGIISKIILVSAPVNFFKSLESIKINCSTRYTAIGDTRNFNKINGAFAILNSNPSIENEIGAIGNIFQLGLMKPCDLYTPSQPTQAAKDLHATVAKLHVAVPQENLFYPMGNFVINEHYIHVDQSQWVKDHAEHIFGIYGAEDGLFTPSVLAEIKADLAANQKTFSFQLINGASHAIYIDQQDKFLDALVRDLK